ncbi:MAG: 3-deoxy-D-manno-octulosonic acid transferase [Pseudomonadota bacterium]
MFWLYRLLSILIAPLLGWRLQRAETDAARRAEGRRQRRGNIQPAASAPLWIHAASVGEVNAIRPLAEALLKRYRDVPLVISTFTVTGALQVERLFGDRAQHRFLPLDTPGATRRWLGTLSPRLGLIAETEIWPELFHQANKQGLTLALVNARLSARGLERSRRFGRLFAQALQTVEIALCQTQTDADRLVELGLPSERAQVVGNLKFDAPVSSDVLKQAQEFRAQWGARRTWIAGSTRPDEEEVLIGAHQELLETIPDLLLVLAPRHPERIDEVIEQIEAAGLRHQRLGEPVSDDTPLVLVDRIGVLQACYAAGAVAFVGGSLVEIGGHNLLEPAALGKPVMTGPHLHNQREMADALGAADALTVVNDSESIADAVGDFLSDPGAALTKGRAALAVVEAGRGSVKSTLAAVEPLIAIGSPERRAGN